MLYSISEITGNFAIVPLKQLLVRLLLVPLVMKKTRPLSLKQTLQHALWLALAASPTLGCGAVVGPGADVPTDGDASINMGEGCRHPNGEWIPVGQSRGLGCNACTCIAPDQLACADCPQMTCALPDGRRIHPGETAQIECNTCFCDQSANLNCTARACVDAGVSDVPNECAPRVINSAAGCEVRVEYPCGAPGGPIDPMFDRARCPTLCAPAAVINPAISPEICNFQSFVGGGASGPNTIFCGGCGVGRLTDGVECAPVECEDGSLGQWLAHSAWFEAVASDAFDRLADELLSLNAPEHLVRRARQSAREEVEHHEVMKAFAAKEGVGTRPARRELQAPRSLAEIAIENAGEGCVRETLGALVMQWQSLHAESAELRAAFAKISLEETAHAEWSWELDAWARSVLSAADVARMDEARAATLAALKREMCDREPQAVLHNRAGMPGISAVSAMIEHLESTVWN